ncbi:hypothetical protein BGY98DRAFT_1094235 [Russula aff. rugulosa BPL654]|nr:hypothetical protein BGY98DRAFT_1094235 [Russula aff. rugulosa BPL654]
MSAASTVVGYGAIDGLTGPSKTPAASAQPPPANSGQPPANSSPPPPANSGPPPPANSSPPPPANSSPPPPANSGPPPPANSGPHQLRPPPYLLPIRIRGPIRVLARRLVAVSSVRFKRKRSATSASELFSRTDLDLALKLFKRVLDELD